MTTEVRSEERLRIDNMLSGGKISEEDHKILVSALDQKPHWTASASKVMVNPFGKLSTTSTVSVGAAIVLLMSWIGARLGIHFPGILDFQIIAEGKRVLLINELVVQNTTNGFVAAIVFYMGSLIARQRNLRFIDFLGAFFFARLPYALFLIFLLVFGSTFPSLLPRLPEQHQGAGIIVLAVVAITLLVWLITLMFSGLKESSGLRGKPLWTCFSVGLVIAEAISIMLNSWLLR